jgi:hypothetical protein
MFVRLVWLAASELAGCNNWQLAFNWLADWLTDWLADWQLAPTGWLADG